MKFARASLAEPDLKGLVTWAARCVQARRDERAWICWRQKDLRVVQDLQYANWRLESQAEQHQLLNEQSEGLVAELRYPDCQALPHGANALPTAFYP